MNAHCCDPVTLSCWAWREDNPLWLAPPLPSSFPPLLPARRTLNTTLYNTTVYYHTAKENNATVRYHTAKEKSRAFETRCLGSIVSRTTAGGT